MSGHSKWKTTKNKKEKKDKKRSKEFAKLLSAIRAAAKDEPNPQFNPRLRTAVDKAKDGHVPAENIERALSQAKDKNFKDMVIEAYGPSGVALIVLAITDNSNRTIAEIRKIIGDHNGKIANPGSVLWGFEQPSNPEEEWVSKFPQTVEPAVNEQIDELVDELTDHDDVTAVYTNIATAPEL